MTILTAAPETALDADLRVLSLDISDDQENWHRITFEGESAAYIDAQAAAWIAERPYLSVQMQEDGEPWALFPKTFDAVFASITADQRLVQVHTI